MEQCVAIRACLEPFNNRPILRNSSGLSYPRQHQVNKYKKIHETFSLRFLSASFLGYSDNFFYGLSFTLSLQPGLWATIFATGSKTHYRKICLVLYCWQTLNINKTLRQHRYLQDLLQCWCACVSDCFTPLCPLLYQLERKQTAREWWSMRPWILVRQTYMTEHWLWKTESSALWRHIFLSRRRRRRR